MVAVLAAALMAGSARHSAFVNRVVSSARTFQHNFCDLKASSNSLNTIERFVFSLALTSTGEKSRT
jgi:hypothetical protein